MEYQFNIPLDTRCKLREIYCNIIKSSNTVLMKWGRNTIYLKAMNDLEAASLRLHDINSTKNISDIDQVFQDLGCTAKELETALEDTCLPNTEGFYYTCYTFAKVLIETVGWIDKKTFLKEYRVLILLIEWNLHFYTCYFGQIKELVEQRIQSDDETCKEILVKWCLEIPSCILKDEFRKQKYFQESNSHKSITDVDMFYEKLYPVIIKCSALYMRDGVNETCNKIKDGLESVSAQVLRMMTTNDLTELHRPFNNLIRLEKEFESVLKTIDIQKYKPVFDEWETRKDHPGEPRQCENCAKSKVISDFHKWFHEKSYPQKGFVFVMVEEFLEKDNVKNVKRSWENDPDETETPLREEKRKCIRDTDLPAQEASIVANEKDGPSESQ